ncbi:MAG: DUF4124 domain-containing protein [Halioglobus sp.]|nr:DUF4124 domain-containing protein [Halioglobus sp.]
MRRRVLVALLFLLPALGGAETLYKTTDRDGNVIFSDTPAPDGVVSEKITVREPNTAPPPPSMPAPSPEPKSAAAEATAYSVAIIFPTDETTIPNGPGNFSVSAEVTPPLQDSDALQLYIDGIPWGEPQSVPSWSLTNIFRGEHSLKVAVIDTDNDDRHLAASAPIRVYVHRPSINFRNRD